MDNLSDSTKENIAVILRIISDHIEIKKVTHPKSKVSCMHIPFNRFADEKISIEDLRIISGMFNFLDFNNDSLRDSLNNPRKQKIYILGVDESDIDDNTTAYSSDYIYPTEENLNKYVFLNIKNEDELLELKASLRSDGNQDKKIVILDLNNKGIYLKDSIGLSYEISGKRREIVGYLFENIDDASSIKAKDISIKIEKTEKYVIAAISGVNKVFKRDLGLDEGLISSSKTSGYKLNKDSFMFESI